MMIAATAMNLYDIINTHPITAKLNRNAANLTMLYLERWQKKDDRNAKSQISNQGIISSY